jgi:hypothetical protein
LFSLDPGSPRPGNRETDGGKEESGNAKGFLFHFWDSDFPKSEGDCAPPRSAKDHNQLGWNGLGRKKERWHGRCIGARQPMNAHKSTTYDLIMQSEFEDKNRTLLETVIYALFTLSAIVSIWQFVVQPIAVPLHTTRFASNQTNQCVQREI